MAAFLRILITFTVILTVSRYAEGTMGCAKFGHSCFGGYGKRGDPVPNTYEDVFREDAGENVAVDQSIMRFSQHPSNSFFKLNKKQCNSLSRLLKNWVQEVKEAQENVVPIYYAAKEDRA